MGLEEEGGENGRKKKKESVAIWTDAKLQQERFVPAPYVTQLIRNEGVKKNDSSTFNPLYNNDDDVNELHIRDVSLGDNHTLVLSSNKKSVYAFGRAMDGQLGLGIDAGNKPFISPPKKSYLLSVNDDENNDESSSSLLSKGKEIHAVCAFENCSATLGENGNVLSKVGKCKNQKAMMGILKCMSRARE